MKIGSWKTRSIFGRYAIVTEADIAEALQKLQSSQDGHRIGA